MSEPAKATEKKKTGPKASHASEVTKPGFFVKLVLMMLIDALGLYGMFTAYLVKSWTVLAVLAVLLLVVNWVYFSKRMIPAMGAVWNFWGQTEADIVTGKDTPDALWGMMVTNIEGAIASK